MGFVGYYRRFIPSFADLAEPLVALSGKDVPFVWRPTCATAFIELRDAMIRAPILAFPTESGVYILDTDASNFGLGGDPWSVSSSPTVAGPYDLPSGNTAQRREKCWRQFRCVYSFVHTYAELGSLCGRTTSPWCGCTALRTRRAWWLGGYMPCSSSSSPSYIEPEVTMETPMDFHMHPLTPADSVLVWTAPRWTRLWGLRINPLMRFSVGESEDGDPVQSGEDWIAQLDDDLSRPASQPGEVFSISALQLEDPTCVTILEWIRFDTFPPWTGWSRYARNYDFCGIIKIICQRTLMVSCGGSGALQYHNFSY